MKKSKKIPFKKHKKNFLSSLLFRVLGVSFVFFLAVLLFTSHNNPKKSNVLGASTSPTCQWWDFGCDLTQIKSFVTTTFLDNADITVDLNQQIAPLHHNATGFVENVNNIDTTSPLVTNLHPNFIRTGDTDLFIQSIYNKTKNEFARVQFVLNTSYGFRFCQPPTYSQNCIFPGDNGDWAGWNSFVTNYVNKAKTINYVNEWDIWGEPDKQNDTYGAGFINAKGETQFFQAWEKAYNLIKGNFPQATIDGPSLAQFSSTNPNLMEDFLNFAKNTHTLPDHISWHSNGANPGLLANDIGFVRNWLSMNGFPVIPIDIQEYQGSHIYSPGGLVSFIKAIEENAVLGAAHSCWNPRPDFSDCAAGNLDGAISSDGKPTPLWWVYDLYGQMNGNILMSQSQIATISTLSSFDGTYTIYLLVGNNAASDVSPKILLKNISSSFGQAFISGYEIPNLSTQSYTNINDPSLSSPIQSLSSDSQISFNSLNLHIPRIHALSAYYLKIVFASGSAPTPTPLPTSTPTPTPIGVTSYHECAKQFSGGCGSTYSYFTDLTIVKSPNRSGGYTYTCTNPKTASVGECSYAAQTTCTSHGGVVQQYPQCSRTVGGCAYDFANGVLLQIQKCKDGTYICPANLAKVVAGQCGIPGPTATPTPTPTPTPIVAKCTLLCPAPKVGCTYVNPGKCSCGTLVCSTPQPSATPTPIPYTLVGNMLLSASNTKSGYPVSYAVDGNLSTFWSSGKFSSSGNDQWIELNLQRQYTISEIKLNVQQYPAGNTTHIIYAGTSSNPSTEVAEFSQPTQTGQSLEKDFSTPLVGVQYIRVVTTQSPSFVAWNEIQVWGK